MVYLKSFSLLTDFQEGTILEIESRRIFNSVYPLHIFPIKDFKDISFKEITIFYGGNGSGKSTLLNIIASKIAASRKSPIDKGAFFDLYVNRCEYEMSIEDPMEIKAITSDDVFDYLLDIRSINTSVNRRKERLSQEFLQNKFSDGFDSFGEYERIKEVTDAKTKTMSRYVRERLANNNIIEHSNGESALFFWEREIKENGIYILDEPENSLSAENQIKLMKFIEESVRFYHCQFIISTHSPFLLAMRDAKIYNLDSLPVKTQKWTTLPNVRLYYDFFKENEEDFD